MRSVVGIAAIAWVACMPPRQLTPTVLPELAAPVEFPTRSRDLRSTLAHLSIAIDAGDELVVGCVNDLEHGERCTRCPLATNKDLADIDPELLDAIARAFTKYPTELLDASGVERIALCRRIHHDGTEENSGPAGLADVTAHRLLVSLDSFVGRKHDSSGAWTIEDIVHHELFHLLDFELLRERQSEDNQWTALNPIGFSYAEPGLSIERPIGFVNAYSSTNQLEDRASVFQYLLARPADLCEIANGDRIVAAKTVLIWRRVAAITGELFLHERAPCVWWIDEPNQAPSVLRRYPAPEREPKQDEWLRGPVRPDVLQ